MKDCNRLTRDNPRHLHDGVCYSELYRIHMAIFYTYVALAPTDF